LRGGIPVAKDYDHLIPQAAQAAERSGHPSPLRPAASAPPKRIDGGVDGLAQRSLNLPSALTRAL
jgi:hypothetical protein